MVHAIHDILEAIGRVQEITRGKTFEEFESSWQLRWLVQRALEIISEASRAIPSDLTSKRPEIPWSRVAGIGNVLRHEYSGLVRSHHLERGRGRIATTKASDFRPR